jgi:hypothetical protein
VNLHRRALSLAAVGAVAIGSLVAAPAHAEGTSPIEVVHQQFTGRNASAYLTDLPDFDQRTPNTAYYAIDLFGADNNDSDPPSAPFVSIGVRYMHTDDVNVMHDDDTVFYPITDAAVVDIAEGLTSGHIVGTFSYKTVFHPDGTFDLVYLPAPVTVTADFVGGHPDNTVWGSHYADGNTRFANQTINRMRDATATVDGMPDFTTLTSTQASLANSLTNAITICRGACAG